MKFDGIKNMKNGKIQTICLIKKRSSSKIV